MIVPGRIWYVAVAHARQDTTAARWLRDEGFEVYLPKSYERAPFGKIRRPVVSLLLSPYIFLRFDAAKGEHALAAGVKGVSHLLTDPTGDPSPLRVHDRTHLRDSLVGAARFIEDLKQAEDDELAAAEKAPSRNPFALKRGTQVRVVAGAGALASDGRSGPLEGPIALIEGHHVTLLVGALRWRVPISDVVPA